MISVGGYALKLDKRTMFRVALLIIVAITFYWMLCEMEKVISILNRVIGLFSPFIAGGIIAFILNVPMRGYERLLSGIKKATLRRAIAIVLTILSVFIVLALVCLLLLPQLFNTVLELMTQLRGLPQWFADAGKNFLNKYPQVKEWINSGLIFDSIDWGSLAQNFAPKLGDALTTVVSQLITMISSLANGVMNTFLAVVFSVYCLICKDSLARQGRKVLYAFFPELFADRVIRVLRLSNLTFSNFLSGQFVEAIILACLFAVTMALFGMPYIPLICVLIAVTAFIPIVGALIGCFVGAFLIAVSDPLLAVYFVILSIVVQQLENNLIYPRVVGTSIGLPGMWVLVAVSVGGAIMGVGGMFIMIPLSSVAYSVFRIYTNKRLKNLKVDEEKLKCHPLSFKKRTVKMKNNTVHDALVKNTDSVENPD